ncbi:MAG: hypothetical protein ACP5U2_13625, partial [Bryobacteraceae bacterium]
MSRLFSLAALLWALAGAAWPAETNRYALLLEDPPLVVQVASREELESVRTRQASQRIAARQGELRQELARRGIAVTGASHIL